MSIREFLGFGSGDGSARSGAADTQTVRRIVATLDAMDPQRARTLAAFAFILCRAARADLCVSEEETGSMERIVIERGGLTEEQAILVVQMAKTQNALFGGTENFLVTREFNKLATRQEKLALLDCLFAVASSDDSISTAEDNEIARVCSELQLRHEDLVAARVRYREYLAVLKKTPARVA